jgi:peptidoglycan/LPS O-acetylase OafA/YrhL
MRQNFAFVQALRGIAALWVVLFHMNEGGHIPALHSVLPPALADFLFDSGHYGVAIFFTLSGFVIAHSLSGAEMTPGNWGRFMLRRSVRLDPAYWASMAAVVALGVVSAAVKHEAFDLPSGGSIAAHMAYLQVFLGFPDISPVYWTLTYEIQFYAVFAAAMMFPRHMWLLTPLAFFSAAGAFNDLVPGLFINLWASFFIGVLAKYAAENSRWLIGIALIGLPLAWSGDFGTTNVVTALVLWGAVRWGWAEHGLNWRWLQFLGTISYSLYLIHNPVSGAAGFVAHRIFGAGILADLAAMVAIVAASVAAAFCLWLLVERPTHRLSRRIFSSRSEPPTALAVA